MNDEIIVNEIEAKLNELAHNFELDNQFIGEVGYYDHDWLTKHINSIVIPFVLTNIGFTKEPTVYGRYNGRYALAFLMQSKDREVLYQIMKTFVNDLTTFDFTYEDKKYITMPTSYDMGVDFEGGDGVGGYYFEVLINLTITQSFGVLSGKDRTITFDGVEIPNKSIKFEHGKLDLSNIDNGFEGYTDDINKYTNTASVIIETYMTQNNPILQDFLRLDKTNQTANLSIKYGDFEVLNDTFTYDGHLLSNKDDDDAMIFLYFSKSEKKNEIVIYNQNDEPIVVPISSYGIGTNMLSEPHTKPNTNLGKAIFYGRVRSYVFVVSESFATSNIEFFDILYNQLLDDEVEAPLMNIGIRLNERPERIKTLLLTDIQKSSKDGGRAFLTLSFADGSDI